MKAGTVFFLVPNSIFSHPNNKHLIGGFVQHILWTIQCSIDFTNDNFFNPHSNSMMEFDFYPFYSEGN